MLESIRKSVIIFGQRGYLRQNSYEGTMNSSEYDCVPQYIEKFKNAQNNEILKNQHRQYRCPSLSYPRPACPRGAI